MECNNKKTKMRSFRLSEEDYNKIASMAKIKQCSQSEVIVSAINNNAESLDSKSLYKELMLIHTNLAAIEKKSSVDTTELRKGLMRICRILNTNEKM